jgi:hypothetical protein
VRYALPFILVLFIQINGFAEVSIEFNDTRLEMAFDSISRQAALTMVVTDAKGCSVPGTPISVLAIFIAPIWRCPG